MAQFYLGVDRMARRCYGFDEIALVPGRITLNPEEVVIQRVRRSLDAYHAACRAGAAPDYSGA